MSHRFIIKHQVTKKNLDDLNHVNNVQYLFWAQEIAKTHWETLTLNTDLYAGIWVVRSHKIEYRSNAYEGDRIRIETYVDSVRGPLSNRNVLFYNDQLDKLLVKSQTQWCYLEPKTRKPTRIPSKIQQLLFKNQ